jgi:hypothetical protein
MKARLLFGYGCLAALLLAGGCRVEERMVWAPDGSRAAVRVQNELCLMDSTGKLSAPLASNVLEVAWLSDGKSLVLVRAISVATWAEGARLLPSNEVATVESLARGLLDVAKGALAAAGNDVAAVEEKFIKPLNITPSEFIIPALICLFDTRKEELRRLVDSATNNAEAVKALTEPRDFTIHELAIYPVGGGAPLVLERSLKDLTAPRVCPAQPLVAYLRGAELVVTPLAGGTNRVVVAEKATGHFDWTPDGKALVYAVPGVEKWADNAINLFGLQRRAVSQEQGGVVAGAVQALAQAAANFEPRIRCLPDGRVLFAGLALQLPAAVEAKPVARFYLTDGSAAPIAIATPAEALPQDLAAFAPSPDGKRIAVVNAGDDEVKLVNIASGAVKVISPQRTGKSRALPAWRGTNELFFAAFPSADAQRPEWLRWSSGAAPQVISGAWVAGAVTNLVVK